MKSRISISLVFILVLIAQVLLDFFWNSQVNWALSLLTLLIIITFSTVYYWVEVKKGIALNNRIRTLHIVGSAAIKLSLDLLFTFSIHIQAIEPRRYYTFGNEKFQSFSFNVFLTLLVLFFLLVQVSWGSWLAANILKQRKNN